MDAHYWRDTAQGKRGSTVQIKEFALILLGGKIPAEASFPCFVLPSLASEEKVVVR